MVRIFVIDEFLDRLCEVLYEFGFIEVKRASNFVSSKEGVRLLDNSVLIKESEELKAEIRRTMDLLNLPGVKGESETKISTGMIEELRSQLKEVFSQVEKLTARIKDNEEKVNELTVRTAILNAIEERGLTPRNFQKSENIVAKAGVISREYLKSIKSFEEAPMLSLGSDRSVGEAVIIEVVGEFVDNVFLFCLALVEKEEQLTKFLESIKFREVIIDVESDSVDEAISNLELEIWQLREDTADCRQKLNRIKKKFAKKLSEALWIIEENQRIYKAMGKFLASARGHIIAGWVPQSKIRMLEDKLKKFSSAVRIDKEPAEYLIRRGFNLSEVPSYLGHKILQPFEKLLKFYGIPAYRHIDPTFFMAVSFIVMFGMMFADLGHGLSLAVLGIALNFFRRLKDAGRILMLSGLSGASFGLFFGSFFGREDILSPLWFNPSREPEKFLAIGVGLGIMMITLGIILNIVQNMSQHKIKEAVFSQWGMISVIFYWLILYIGAAILRYHINIPGGWLLIIFFAPLFIIVLGNLIGRKKELADVVFTPLEIVMSLLTNTISFVRVAAFGLAHAALGVCVWLVAYSMGNIAGLKESLIVEGNVGIILFEGLIVFIQTLRLEFYEFFSKFFHLEGEEFKPLRERR